MTSFTGTSKSDKINRYYKCVKFEPCPQSRTLKKDASEQAITQAFQTMLSTESNFNLLVDKILETYNSKLYDTSTLRLAEKELSRVETSLSNLIAAVENGFYSETTNTRLKELEARKTELKEIISVEKAKEIKPLEREQVTKYMSYAISQPSQVLIDLLVRKAIVRDEVVDIYLKYAKGIPPKDTKKNGRPIIYKNPERNLSERGFLFMQYSFYYKVNPVGRKPLGFDYRQGKTKSIQVQIFV